MSADGGSVVVQLTLDNGQYRVATLNATDLMRQLKHSIDLTATSTKRLEQHSDSLGRKFRDLVLTLGNLRFVAMDINDIFLRLPVSILKTAGEMEKMQALMVGLSNETNRLKKEAEGLGSFNYVIGVAKNAPFEVAALADSFVKLKSSGIDPTNGSMQALVDSVARFGGSSEQLKRASVAIQQMAGKGVISMEELRQQLGEAVPTAMRSMAEGLGVTMAELAKTVSTGTLAAGPAISAMLARMAVENDQAAQEMMKTWVGMLARLKTEWSLTAKDIADAGLGDAAKEAVKELTDSMQGNEFRDFAKAFGSSMGDILRFLTDGVKFAIQYREEIGLLVKAFIAYKVATSLYLPALVALNKAREQGSKLLAQERSAVSRFVTNRGEEISRMQSIVATSAAERNATAKFLADQQTELAAVRAKNAAILASDRALAAQMAINRGGIRIEGQGRFQSRAAGAAELARLSAVNSVLIAQERALTTSIAQTKLALDAGTASVLRHTTALGAMTYATRAAAVAAVTLNAAAKAGNVVLGLMGGWVGVAITAILGLVYVYQKLTGAADEATAAMKRQKNESSTREDLSALEEDVKKRRAALKFAEYEANHEKEIGTGRVKTALEMLNARKSFERQKAELSVLEGNLTRRALIVRESEASEELVSITSTTRRFVQATADAAGDTVRAIREKKNAELGALKENSKEWLEVRNRYNKAEEKEFLAGRTLTIKGLEEMAENAEQAAGRSRSLTQAQRDALITGAREQRRQAEQIRQELGNFNQPVGAPTPKKPEGPKAPKDSPIQNFLENLKETRAAIEAEIAGFDKTGDKVAAVEAKLWAKYDSGDFDDKETGRRPNKTVMASLVGEARAVEEAKKKLADLEKFAKDVEKVTDFIEGMRPEVDAAMELLADPLGSATKGAALKRVDKFIGKNLGEIKAQALATKKTVEEVVASMRTDAMMVDDGERFSELARETEQLNAGMVDDSRDAARARAEAEDARHAKAIANIIKERAEAGIPVEQLQKYLDENTAARAGARSEKFLSPLETLAQNWKNTTKNMEDASVGWANSTADAFTEMAMTGKADFAGLARSIIADLVRIQIQKALSSAISAATSFFFADGGVMSSGGSLPLKKYAAGGIANSPQMAVFGEGRMNEAYVPLPDGRTIPVTMKGGSGAGGGDVQINITVHEGGGETTTDTGANAAMYKAMGQRIKQVVHEEIVNARRPGGSLYT